MKEREHKTGGRPAARPHGPMGGGPRGGGEKPKDLIGTWKKLLGRCRKYTVWMIVALVGAVAGTVLHLLGPELL